MDAAIGDKNDIAARAAVAAVGNGMAHIFIAVVTFTALASVAGMDKNPGFINKRHTLSLVWKLFFCGNFGNIQNRELLAMAFFPGGFLAAAKFIRDQFFT